MKSIFKALVVLTTVLFSSAGSTADTDTPEYDALRKQLKELQNRIAVLEATAPTFTSLMPNIAERFHVMHRAGEAGDWAVAKHELEELRRLTAVSTYINARNGQLMQGMMGPNFEGLDNAIEHGNEEKFQIALEQTVDTCNACHTATGSSFVQVTLDARDSISLRHPHALMERGVPGGHSHGATKKSQQMLEHMEGMMQDKHGDNKQQKHTD